MTRTVTALVLAPFAIAGLLWLPSIAFALVLAAAFLIALWEWAALAGLRTPASRASLVVAGAAAMLLLWITRDGAAWWLAILAGLAWWAVAVVWLRHFSFGAAPTRENIALKLVVGLLVVVPAWAALVAVRADDQLGPAWALLGFGLIWVADSGAYLAGRRWGVRKLAPRISPGKTWAGVGGALVTSAVVALIYGWLVLDLRGIALVGVQLLAIVTVAASIVGDLFESLIKRHANAKDSGDLFPGHGGMFDRLDSVFAAMPVWATGLAVLFR